MEFIRPEPLLSLMAALRFAAHKHSDQRRKGVEASPYINHAIEVTETLVSIGGVTDIDVLRAAALHDTLEDTETTPGELEREFGEQVRALVEEVTDDTRLPSDQRKLLQIRHTGQLSAGAKQIRISDKICNVKDVVANPPARWPRKRRVDYLTWTEHVVAGCRGVNPALDELYDRTLDEGHRALAALEPR